MDPYAALLVVFFGAFPSFEARYAIPFAIVLGFPPGWAFFFGILGNLLPIIPLLLLLGLVSDWLRNRSTLMEKFFTLIFERTRKNEASIARWGVYALFLFVAIPLPGTGVWTGAAMAFVFNIEWKTAFVAISAGAVVAAMITTFPTLGFLNLLEDLS